jgi:heme-degrading monooxygenase HmoA
MAEAYVSFLKTKVFQDISRIDGYRGAYILRKEQRGNNSVEFLVITLWDSMEAVRKFAGNDPTVAVVEEEARTLLSSFDRHVSHYSVVHTPE